MLLQRPRTSFAEVKLVDRLKTDTCAVKLYLSVYFWKFKTGWIAKPLSIRSIFKQPFLILRTQVESDQGFTGRDGFVLLYKRLENARFQWPGNQEEVRMISGQELRWLLEGLAIDQPKAVRKLYESSTKNRLIMCHRL